jgi:hypothetical protein
MLMDHVPRCPCSHYATRHHDPLVLVLGELMAEMGTIKGRDLRLEIRRIRSRASQDRHRGVVWLDFAAPHKYLDVDVTVTSDVTTSCVPAVRALLPLPCNKTMGAQQAKLYVDLCTSSSFGTPPISPFMTITTLLLRTGAGWLL